MLFNGWPKDAGLLLNVSRTVSQTLLAPAAACDFSNCSTQISYYSILFETRTELNNFATALHEDAAFLSWVHTLCAKTLQLQTAMGLLCSSVKALVCSVMHAHTCMLSLLHSLLLSLLQGSNQGCLCACCAMNLETSIHEGIFGCRHIQTIASNSSRQK